MKNSTHIFVYILLIAGLCNLQGDINYPNSLANQKLIHKNKPSDFFFHQRAYPDSSIDIKAYKDGLNQVRNDIEKKNSMYPSQISWLSEGPGNIGGRINEIIVHPFDSSIMYAGSAAGGIFKTIDGGQNWESIFDDHAYLAIGELIFDPQDPDIIYAGTGDPNITGYPFIGNGIYKSLDAGQSWEHLGLSEVGIVSKISIDPNNSDLIYVAAMGLPFEQNIHRGLYKSTNGGLSWDKVLYLSNNAGIIDLIVVPNSQTIYAAGWNRIRNNSQSILYGQQSKIYKSTNGGSTWNVLTNGLPTNVMSRIGLCMSGSDTSLLYAVMTNTSLQVGGVYKTTDAGASWTSLPVGTPLSYAYGGFGWYFGQIRISPYNDNELFILGIDLYKSSNGGLTWAAVGPNWATNEFYADKHDLIFVDSLILISSTDGGLFKSVDGGNTWTDNDNITNTQFYRVAIDPHNPGYYAGGAQDNGTLYGSISNYYSWQRINGGDGFQPLFDYINPNIMYTELQDGLLYYKNGGGWLYFGTGIYSNDRRAWDMPIIMSSHSPSVLYTGTYRIYKNPSAPTGSWALLSPDLTDGINNKFHVISCLDESSIDASVLYAGTSDGNVSRSLNGGAIWEAIFTGLPDRYVTSIKASPNYVNSVFVSHSGYRDNEFIPHVHKSVDYGNTWVDISGDLPQISVNDLVILEGYGDQVILAATDGGVYFTDNGGQKWARLSDDMPIIPVYDIEYDSYFHKIIVGSYARSMISLSIDSLLTIVSIEEPEITKPGPEVYIYPNPASSMINISGLSENIGQAMIVSTQGEIVKSVKIQNQQDIVTVNVEDLKPGIYSVVIDSELGRKSGKFSIVR
ncbi:MAG: T9SS type A sorting domain-containing protein [Bacteroidales bacterium]|nr:T9SS type A sorting domain-containing protein [Bacteroidales bacterium]MCF8455428.1 T9SS type A sorting domain-containing protein [Bacteroidales bacterium]